MARRRVLCSGAHACASFLCTCVCPALCASFHTASSLMPVGTGHGGHSPTPLMCTPVRRSSLARLPCCAAGLDQPEAQGAARRAGAPARGQGGAGDPLAYAGYATLKDPPAYVGYATLKDPPLLHMPGMPLSKRYNFQLSPLSLSLSLSRTRWRWRPSCKFRAFHSQKEPSHMSAGHTAVYYMPGRPSRICHRQTHSNRWFGI